jgi:hypothetical protein
LGSGTHSPRPTPRAHGPAHSPRPTPRAHSPAQTHTSSPPHSPRPTPRAHGPQLIVQEKKRKVFSFHDFHEKKEKFFFLFHSPYTFTHTRTSAAALMRSTAHPPLTATHHNRSNAQHSTPPLWVASPVAYPDTALHFTPRWPEASLTAPPPFSLTDQQPRECSIGRIETAYVTQSPHAQTAAPTGGEGPLRALHPIARHHHPSPLPYPDSPKRMECGEVRVRCTPMLYRTSTLADTLPHLRCENKLTRCRAARQG